MIHRFLLLLLLIFCAPAFAQSTLHYCSCSTGSHGSCVAGDNANAGTAASPKLRPVDEGELDTVAAGSSALFCDGGSWTDWPLTRIANFNVTETSPLTIDRYAPPTGATGIPVITAASGASAFSFQSAGQDGGYTIRNLRLIGTGSGDIGGIYAHTTRNLLIENMEISHFLTGVTISVVTEASNIFGATIRNNYIHHNRFTGINGSAADLLIENNILSKNGTSGNNGFHHNIYMSSDNANNTIRATIRNNRFEHPGNADTDGTLCSGGNLTARGRIFGLVIEHNTVVIDQVGGGCVGFSLNPGYIGGTDEAWFGLIIRANLLINGGITLTAAPDCLVENNVVVMPATGSWIGIWFPARDMTAGEAYDTASGDEPDNGCNVRNNSIRMDNPQSGSTGILSNSNVGPGNNVKITNNLISFGDGTGTARCMGYTSPLTRYDAVSHNLCYNADQWESTYTTLASAQAQTVNGGAQLEAGSSTSDPLLVANPTSGNNWSMQIQSGSPARNAGTSSNCARLTKTGHVRTGVCTIGAYQFGSGS